MNFRLGKAKEEDLNTLIKYKLESIFDYAFDLEDKEIEKIKNYVNSNIPKQLNDYKIVIVENKKVGCLLVEDHLDGVLLDEIYLIKDYRRYGIGTLIINQILESNGIVYLWVYQKNVKAIELYKKLGFVVDKVTDTRFFMKYCRC